MQVFDFSNMLIAVWLAHLAGEIVNYALGRIKGRTLFHEDSRFFRPRFLEMAESRFQKSGARILMSGQFLGFLRPFISLAAGASHYSIVRFILAMAPACLVWTLFHLVIGYVCGASWRQAVSYMKDLSLLLIVAIPAAFFCGWAIRQLIRMSGSLRAPLERLNGRIRRSPRYQDLSGRHPSIFRFLEGRISITKPWGLSATAGFAAALLFTLFCFAILLDVHSRDSWYAFDLNLVNLLAQLRTPAVTRIFILITHLGSAPVVAIMVTVMVAVCAWRGQYKSLFVILGSIVVSMILNQAIEVIYRRSRPELSLRLMTVGGFSFPSGHATVVFAMFGSLYYWLWNHPGILRIRATLAFILLLCALMVGFSRVYLGLHYPSDVVAGFCVGCAGVFLCATVAVNWARLHDVPRRADIPAVVVLLLYGGVAFGWSHFNKDLPPGHGKELSAIQPDISSTPTYAVTLFGTEYLPLNLGVNGNPTLLLEHLRMRDWKVVKPADFFTREIAAPIFPAFVNDMPADHTMEKRTSETRLLLRLWNTAPGKSENQWVGVVLRQDRHLKWGLLKTFHQDPDIDLPLDDLVAETRDLPVTVSNGFLGRGLYLWDNPFFTHGQALNYKLSDPNME
jgi:undecaprenyl-diphosphatase